MKKMLVAFFGALFIVIVVMIGFTLYGRQARQSELDNALMSGMEKAMDMLLAEENKPQSNKEWEAMFVNAVAVQIESDSDLTVKCRVVDMEKGILSAEAVLTFRHPNGEMGAVASEATIILEEYEAE